MEVYNVYFYQNDTVNQTVFMNGVYQVNKKNEYEIVTVLFDRFFIFSKYTIGKKREDAYRFKYLYDYIDKNNKSYLIDNFYKHINDDEYGKALNELVTYIVDVITFDNFVKLIICGKFNDLEINFNDGYPDCGERYSLYGPNKDNTFLSIIKDKVK